MIVYPDKYIRAIKEEIAWAKSSPLSSWYDKHAKNLYIYGLEVAIHKIRMTYKDAQEAAHE